MRQFLCDLEREAYDKFVAEHFANCLSKVSTTWDSSNGIGTNIEVECNSCHEKKDITDYGSW